MLKNFCPATFSSTGSTFSTCPFSALARSSTAGLRGFQDAVEAADDGEGEDDLAVLGLLVVTSEEVGHGPDEGGVVLDGSLGHSQTPPIYLDPNIGQRY